MVTSTGCAPGGTGQCVKMDCADGNCSDPWTLDIPDAPEVTISWMERYDVWPLEWTRGGCKSIRAYNGPSGSHYLAALMTYHESRANNGIYMSAWEGPARFVPTEHVTRVNDSDAYCPIDHGDGTHGCNVRLAFEWTTDGGATMGMGTSWRRMRMYIGMPTTYDSADGEVRLWIDGELIFTLRDIDMQDEGVQETTRVRFAPVDESGTPHGHWYDEITIYEGLVPPPT